MFQSLFFWMLLSKVAWWSPPLTPPSCFNPYFSGCFSLSLLCLFLSVRPDLCFNPYFSGCFSLSSAAAPVGFALSPGFQSLFFWMLLSKIHHGQWVTFPEKFQSLFFWMLLSKWGDSVRISTGDKASFNPYFSGCFSLRQLQAAPRVYEVY